MAWMTEFLPPARETCVEFLILVLSQHSPGGSGHLVNEPVDGSCLSFSLLLKYRNKFKRAVRSH